MYEIIYLESLKNILETGVNKKINNSNVLSKFSVKMDFDISKNFPLLTTKKMFWKDIVLELLWTINGKTDSKILEYNNINIWKYNTSRENLDNLRLYEYEEGDCGPINGFQWRHFGAKYNGCDKNYNNVGIDQLNNCITLIKNNPYSDRIFMSSWNPIQLNNMCLLPSCISYQFYITNNNDLSCILYLKTGNMFLDIPFNIASASLLIYIISLITNKNPGNLSIIIGNAYICEENIENIMIQLKRTPKELPKLKILKKYSNINDYKFENFLLENYDPYNSFE